MGANKWAQLLLFRVTPSLKAVCLLSIMYSVFKCTCVVTKLIHILLLLTSVYVYVHTVICLPVGMATSDLRSCLHCGRVRPTGFLTRAIFNRGW